jgi:Glycosyltransferase like family 2
MIVRVGAVVAGLFSAHSALNARLLRRTEPIGSPIRERVAVCIPARNEESSIGACLDTVLASVGVDDMSVVVLDDGSSDATGQIVRARMHSGSLALIDGGDDPLPNGWLGKPWACDRLMRSFAAEDVDVFVFIDADVRLEPDAIARAVSLLRSSGLDLVSPYPRQIADTPAERLVQPLLQWLWLTLLPLRLAERTKPNSMAAANGQFLVIDAKALAHAGGFASVRDAVLDDVALVRAFKRSGRRGTVVDGTDLATCRMYTDWSSLRDGYTKNLWAGTGSPGGALALSSLFALAYIVPPFAMTGIFGRAQRRSGLVGYLAAVAGRVISARRTGGRVSDAPAHPASIMLLIHLVARSWRAHRAGTIVWKGRSVG